MRIIINVVSLVSRALSPPSTSRTCHEKKHSPWISSQWPALTISVTQSSHPHTGYFTPHHTTPQTTEHITLQHYIPTYPDARTT